MEGTSGFKTADVGCFPGGYTIPIPTPLEGPPDKVTLVPKLSGQKEQGSGGSLQKRGRAGHRSRDRWASEPGGRKDSGAAGRGVGGQRTATGKTGIG